MGEILIMMLQGKENDRTILAKSGATKVIATLRDFQALYLINQNMSNQNMSKGFLAESDRLTECVKMLGRFSRHKHVQQ
jgi:predicted nucleotide-binding protein (sugar kinase/HSP70/actin superfamily)